MALACPFVFILARKCVRNRRLLHYGLLPMPATPMPDSATWMLLWWATLAILLLAFALVDGFDLGIALLLPVIGRSDAERSACLQVVGPRSEGNGAWLLAGGGAFMAAWPMYASTFSIFWVALALTLGALFLRPLGFELRPLLPEGRIRRWWDGALCVAGLLPASAFGLACGALFTSPGHGPSLFSAFCALLSTLLLVLHGAAMLAAGTTAPMQQRAQRIVMTTAALVAGLLLLGALWLDHLPGPVSPRALPPHVQPGGWLQHYRHWPLLWLLPATGMASLLLCAAGAWRNWARATWVGSCMALTSIMSAGAAALFPFVLPPVAMVDSQQLWQAAALHRTPLLVVLPLLLMLLTLTVARLAPADAGGPQRDAAPAPVL